jgi:hypothetical protein
MSKSKIDNMPIISILNQYVAQHSVHTLEKESDKDVCARNYMISGAQLGMAQFGNIFGSFLSNFAAAVILNRTLVIKIHSSFLQCDECFAMKEWIVNSTYFNNRLSAAGCLPQIVGPEGGPFHFDMCDLKKTSTRKVVTQDDLFNAAYDMFNPLSYNLNTDININYRASVLFNDELYMNSSHVNISEVKQHNKENALARLSSYGFLSKYAFKFGSMVTNRTTDMLAPLFDMKTCQRRKDVFTVAIHLRHSIVETTPLYYENFDSLPKTALGMMIERDKAENGDRKCYVLIASDRDYTVASLTEYAKYYNCTPLVVEKDAALINDGRPVEWGPYTMGITPVVDVYALSHADAFIGSSASTFSLLIGNYIIARSYVHLYLKNELLVKDYSTDSNYPSNMKRHTMVKFQDNVALWCHLFTNQIIHLGDSFRRIYESEFRKCNGEVACCEKSLDNNRSKSKRRLRRRQITPSSNKFV